MIVAPCHFATRKSYSFFDVLLYSVDCFLTGGSLADDERRGEAKLCKEGNSDASRD